MFGFDHIYICIYIYIDSRCWSVTQTNKQNDGRCLLFDIFISVTLGIAKYFRQCCSLPSNMSC